MSRRYRVFWSSSAEKELAVMVESFAADRPDQALAVLKQLQKKTASLGRFPERGRVAPELRDQGIHQYRELIIFPWRIVYRIADDKVLVLTVLDSRRNLEDLLLQKVIDAKFS